MRRLTRIGVRKLIAYYFLATITVYVVIAFRARTNISAGVPDFTIFYTAAKVVHRGDSARLYDEDEQRLVQAEFAPQALLQRGKILPYNHPPFEALLFLPLAPFSYVIAYSAWLTINLALILSLPFLLRPHLPNLSAIPVAYWQFGLLSFFPVFMSLLEGQDSILLLFVFGMAFRCLAQKNDWRAGTWLAVGLFKFQFALPLLLTLPWLRRKPAALGFVSSACAFLLAGLLIAGVSANLTYPDFLWRSERYSASDSYNLPQITPNLRGIIYSLIPDVGNSEKAILLALACLLILLLTIRVGKGERSAPILNSAFALAILAAVLVSYHCHLYDWSILALPVMLLLDQVLGIETDPLAPRPKKILRGGLSLLCFSPLYLALIFHDGMLLWTLAAMPLALFLFVAREILISANTDPHPAVRAKLPDVISP